MSSRRAIRKSSSAPVLAELPAPVDGVGRHGDDAPGRGVRGHRRVDAHDLRRATRTVEREHERRRASGSYVLGTPRRYVRCCSPTVIASGTSPGATTSVPITPGACPHPALARIGGTVLGGDVVAVVDVTGAIVVAATVVGAAVLVAGSVVADREVVAPETGGDAAGSPSSEQAATARASTAPSMAHRARNGISSRLRPDRGCTGDHDPDQNDQDQASTTTRASAAVAGAWRTSDSSNVVVQQANSSSTPLGSLK